MIQKRRPFSVLTDAICIILKVSIGFLFLVALVDIGLFYAMANEQAVKKYELGIIYSWKYTRDQVETILIIIVNAAFLFWIYHANKNLRAQFGEELKYTPAWAVLWFFIPIANLFKPYQVVSEVWRVANQGKNIHGTFVAVWWTCQLLYTFGDVFARKIAEQTGLITNHQVMGAIYLMDATLFIILNLLTLKLVDSIGNAYLWKVLALSGKKQSVSPPEATGI